MTTAIACYTSDGCEGRCDARCHDAKEPDCDCICGGRLHGVGRENAVARNTEDLFGSLETAKAWATAHGYADAEIRMALYEADLCGADIGMANRTVWLA